MPRVPDDVRRAAEPRARPPEPAPVAPPRPGELTPAALLQLQRSVGNRASQALIQRVKDRPDLGTDVVEFEPGDERPNRFGKLASDPANEYKPMGNLGDDFFRKTPKLAAAQFKKADPAETQRKENEQLKAKLATAKKELFGADQNGGTEGSFEYVANYLFGEVFGADRAAAQQIWDEVWTVEEPVGDKPRLVRKDIPDRRKLLQRMIDIGLDASWKQVPVQELVATKVGNTAPAKEMPLSVWTVADYFSSLFNWTPWPDTTGVGFHTTDGAPGAVATAKEKGGWGGITRPGTVDFFKRRYAVAEGWNPLGTWLDSHGPTFRKGIKDNELLSTVSVATAIHGSVRFPLADIKRKGAHDVDKEGKKTFQMEVYIYAVCVREGYATFAKQDANAFGEIATGDIPIEDIIGWSKITRWHQYEDQALHVPSTADFWYEMTPMTRNPQFPAGGIYDRLLVSANGEIEKERALTDKPYKA